MPKIVFASGLIAFAALAGSAGAAQYYVGPSGNGNGSLSNPWSLTTALNSTVVQPGDTIWVRGGTYRAPTSNGFTSYLNGKSGSPIIVRNYNGERATIDGFGTEFALAIYGSYTWFWGLEVMDSNSTKSTNQGNGAHPMAYGVAVYAPGIRCINMIVHDTAEGFSAYNASPDSEYYGNIVYYNGWIGPDRNHGHGLYMQNVSGTKIVADNIVGDNFDEGLQVYGGGNATVTGFRIRGNALYNTSSIPYPHYQYNIVIAGGGARKDIQVQNNYSWFTPEQDYGFNNFGQYTAGTDMLVTDNVFAGGYTAVAVEGQAGPFVFTGNQIYNRPSSVRQVNLTLFGAQTLAGYTWNRNSYFGLNRFYFGSNLDFNSWKSQTGFDTASSFSPDAPRGTQVYVRPNVYEGKRANVIVYNWDSANSVLVDLSGVLQSGDDYVIQDAQNFYGPPVLSGTYAGGSIILPMTGIAKAIPRGLPAPAHTGPRFGTFVVIGPTTAIAPSVLPPPPPDTAPPTVSFASPAAGNVSGTVTVTASVSDNVGVAGVQFQLDGIDMGSEYKAFPYSTSWNTLLVSNGTHILTAIARDAAGNSAKSFLSVTVNNIAPPSSPPSATFTPIRVNAGGPAYTDTQGRQWSGDFGYSGTGGVYTTPNAILGTSDGPLYQSERWTWPGALQYQFTVPVGNYTVNLKFAENYATGPGQRVFNIVINGQTVASNFDIFAQAGGANKGTDKQFTVSSGGSITIQFTPVVGGPKVNAIEILQQSSLPAPVTSSFTAIRVNAGGQAYTDTQGRQWSADFGYSGTGGVYTTPNAILGTSDGPLYQSERWTWPGALQYQFTVPVGSYTVNLKFAENYSTGPGQRVFNIVINGQTVASNFDIFAQAGGANKGADKQFTVSSSGSITIQFTPVVGGPKVNAIEIF